MTATLSASLAPTPADLHPEATLPLSDIAALTGRHRATIKNWNKWGRWPNAVQDTDGRGQWRVPVSDLVAAGDLDAGQVATVTDELAGRQESKAVQELRERIVRLEERLDAARALAQDREDQIKFLRAQLTQNRGQR
jgi:hypothetical protein